MPAPRFDVIVPLYNHERYIAAAIESIRAQTLPDWRLFIVDDGSTDGSGAIADLFAKSDPRITVLHQPNAGHAAARNAALSRTSAPWVALLDSDDLWLPETLSHFARFIHAHASDHAARFIYGHYNRIHPDGATTPLVGDFQDGPTGPVEFFNRMFLNPSCCCFARSLIDQAGLYDTRLPVHVDYDLFLRFSPHTRFHPLGRATTLRRRHETNVSKQTGPMRLLEARVLQRFLDEYGGAPLIPPDIAHKRLARLHYAAGRQFFKARCYAQSIEALRTARRLGAGAKARLLLALAKTLRPAGRFDDRQIPDL